MITKKEYFKWLNGHRKNQVFLAIITAYYPKKLASFTCRANVSKGINLAGGKVLINGVEVSITINSNNHHSTLAQLREFDFSIANVKPYLFRRRGAKTFHIGFKSLIIGDPITVAKSENDQANITSRLGISVGTYHEQSAGEQKIYVSSQPYSSTANDSPTNQQFLPIIKDIPYQRRSISIFNSGSKNDIGELILNNAGELDYWSYLYFKGKQIVICLGDPSWPLSDMMAYPIFVGAVKNEPNELNPEVGENEVSFRFGDIWQELNIPIQDQFISTGVNIDKPIPIILGKCLNLSPVLVNSATQTHTLGGNISPSKVYEGGNDVTYNWVFSNGQITPNSQQWKPFYTVTCDVTNTDKTALDLVQYLVSKNTDFYNKYFGDFGDIANKTYELGIYIDSSMTIIDVLDMVLDSVWGWRLIDNENKFQFGLFVDPRLATPSFFFDESTIVGAVEVAVLGTVFRNTKLKGLKNNTVLKLDGIPEVLKRVQQQGESTASYNARMDRVDFVQTDFKTVRSDAILDSDYPVPEGEPIETLIQSESDLLVEANYRQVLSSTPISKIKLTGNAFFEVLPGDVINVTYPRHGMISGINVFVTETERLDMSRKIVINGIFYGEYE